VVARPETAGRPGPVRRLRPTVVLLDHRMPTRAALVITAIADTGGPGFLTSDGEEELVTGMLRGGARGYLVHGQFDPAELLRAVHAVAGAAAGSPGRGVDRHLDLPGRPSGNGTTSTPRPRQPSSAVRAHPTANTGDGTPGPRPVERLDRLPARPDGEDRQEPLGPGLRKLQVGSRAEAIVRWTAADRPDPGSRVPESGPVHRWSRDFWSWAGRELGF